MGHHHHHHDHSHHHHGDPSDATGNIKVAFFLNLAFTIIEIIGGFYTNSIAILSDALHDLGDSFSLGLAWYFQHLSKKGRTESFSYGYKRFSVLGAIVNSVILLVGCVFILFEAIPRIIHPEVAHAKGMILLAILGIIVNGAAVLKLKKGNSLNERVVSLHLLEDVLGWVAVLIGATIMHFYNLPEIDPILSVLISCYVLYNIFRNVKDTMQVILQGTPFDVDVKLVSEHLSREKNVINLHDLHLWSLDGNYNILTVHLVVEDGISFEAIETLKKQVRINLNKINVQHATIEIERFSEDCSFHFDIQCLDNEDLKSNKNPDDEPNG